MHHDDEAEDKALIESSLKKHHLIRKHGGATPVGEDAISESLTHQGLVRSDKQEKVRAHGGRLPNQKHHMEAGAVSGEGRLEKIGKEGHDAGKPQAV